MADDLREAAQALLDAVDDDVRQDEMATAEFVPLRKAPWTSVAADRLRAALAGVAAGPQATPGQEPVCGGFVWIGQPMTSCDRCGQPAWEHEGLDQPPADPFSDAPSTVRPWKPGEAEAIRAKWGGSSTVHVAEVRRPIPGARDMTGDPTDPEDPTDG